MRSHGFDLVIAADEPKVERAATESRDLGADVEAVQADLATLDGMDRLYAALAGRPVDALLANAGRGLGKAFLDQDFNDVRRVIDTNISPATRRSRQACTAKSTGGVSHSGGRLCACGKENGARGGIE